MTPPEDYLAVLADDLRPVGRRHDDLLRRCHQIRHLHAKSERGGGMTDGYCAECETVWPCRTFHLASGWGDGQECWASHWCDHAKVVMR